MMMPADIEHAVIRLFERMDRAYRACAGKSGFVCNGCRDNCCLTRFDHHTLIEVLQVRSGLRSLPRRQRRRIRASAESAGIEMADLQRRGAPVRVMCPLNENGRCVIYDRRPMICRLHGVPHLLRRPDGRMLSGPGCDDFYRQCGTSGGERLDRTPLYTAMAGLERRLRDLLDYRSRIKLTVAEMIVAPGFDSEI